MLNIIYEDNHLLVVQKPINVPVCADISGDDNLLDMLKKYLKEKYNKPGNVYLGLIHRLDRPVGGIMVFAKTSKAASRLSKQIQNHEFKKTYYAVVCGNINDKGNFFDRLLKNNKLNIVTVNDEGKEAKLSYIKQGFVNNMSLVEIGLHTGRSHQIRVQFAHHGYPLYGDQKYNSNAMMHEQIALFAQKIEFIHPTTKEKMQFLLPLPQNKPWNLFF